MSVCLSKYLRSLCLSFSRKDSGLYIYHLFVWSNVNFLHKSQRMILLTQSYLVLHCFCANLLHSLIMWLIVSPLTPHNLHLLFCCMLYILAFIWFVLLTLFFSAIWRDSVSVLRLPFLCNIYVFSCEILFVSRFKRPQSCFSSHFCSLFINHSSGPCVFKIVSGC